MQSFLVALIAAAIATQTGALPAPATSSAALPDVAPVVGVGATPTVAVAVPTPKAGNGGAAEVCGAAVVPLYKASSDTLSDHLVTTSASEIEAALASGDYIRANVIASVYSNATGPYVLNTVPLYKLFNAAQHDHLLTASVEEMEDVVKNRGYSYQGITAYIHPAAQAGCTEMVPLYRLYNPTFQEHTYELTKPSTNSSTGITPEGYFYEGITGYVFPPDA